MKLALALTALALAPGCVTAQWSRTQRDQPVEARAWKQLRPGHDDLATCLERLGAPLHVFEQADGAALAFGWSHDETWGLAVSVPVARAFSASLDLERVARELEGVVLFFDRDWILRFARRGKLAEIVQSPPALLEGS